MSHSFNQSPKKNNSSSKFKLTEHEKKERSFADAGLSLERGDSLSTDNKSYLEGKLGHDFSNVKQNPHVWALGKKDARTTDGRHELEQGINGLLGKSQGGPGQMVGSAMVLNPDYPGKSAKAANADALLSGRKAPDPKAKKLQRKEEDGQTKTEVSPLVEEALRERGHPLDSRVKSEMEKGFGKDLSGVRIHEGNLAAQSAKTMSAKAYTVGQDVVMGQGQYDPESHQGKKLLAHELAHTIQQSQAGTTLVKAKELQVSQPEDPGEREADEIAEETINKGQVSTVQLTPFRGSWGRRVHRESLDGATQAASAPILMNLSSSQAKEGPSSTGKLFNQIQSGIESISGVTEKSKNLVYVLLRQMLRSGQISISNQLKQKVEKLPEKVRPQALLLISGFNRILDVVDSNVLAEVQLSGGATTGLVDLVTGLLTLGAKISELMVALVMFDTQDLSDNAKMFSNSDNLGDAIDKPVTDWIVKYDNSQSEVEKSQLVNDLSGQILFNVAAFFVVAGKVGNVGRVSEGVEELNIVRGTSGITKTLEIVNEFKKRISELDLDEQDELGGHTIDRHVGKTKKELMLRIVKDGLESNSTFFDQNSATRFIAQALEKTDRNYLDATIKSVAETESDRPLKVITLDESVGWGIRASGDVVSATKRIQVRLGFENGKVFIRSSFPFIE